MHEERKEELSRKNKEAIFQEVTDDIIDIYARASVPTVSRKNVKLRVENLWQKRIEKRTPKTIKKMKKWGKKKIKLPDIIELFLCYR